MPSKIFAPRILLHLEGLLFLVAAGVFYGWLHFSWLYFAIGFFVPDLSMLGYLVNRKTGTGSYNLFHTYSIPLLLLIIFSCIGENTCDWIALIWIAHIGFDRMLGFGIKYETAFKDTHLQRV